MREIFHSLWHYNFTYPGRFFLGLLTVFWGTALCLIFYGLAQGIYQINQADVERFNLPAFFIKTGLVSIATPFHTIGEIVRIQPEIMSSVVSDMNKNYSDNPIKIILVKGTPFTPYYQNRDGGGAVLGYSENYVNLLKFNLAYGRSFNAQEVQEAAHVAVIDNANGSMLNNLFHSKESPVGRVITIGSVPFKVIGYVNNDHMFNGAAVQIPYTTAQQFQGLMTSPNRYILLLPEHLNLNHQKKLEGQLRDRLAAFLHLNSSDTSAIYFSSVVSHIGLIYKASLLTFYYFLLAIGLGLLLLSNLVLMLFLTLSLSRRQEEMGLRKALGSSQRRIIFMLCAESFAYFFLGFLMAWMLSKSISLKLGQSALGHYFGQPVISWNSLLFVFILGFGLIVMGIFLVSRQFFKRRVIDLLDRA